MQGSSRQALEPTIAARSNPGTSDDSACALLTCDRTSDKPADEPRILEFGAAMEHLHIAAIVLDARTGEWQANQHARALIADLSNDNALLDSTSIAARLSLKTIVAVGAKRAFRQIQHWLSSDTSVPLLMSTYEFNPELLADLRASRIGGTLKLLTIDPRDKTEVDRFRSLRLAAERSHIARARYLAGTGHDLLQPLSAARLLASTIGEAEELSDGTAKLVTRLSKALIAAESIVDELTDVARVDAIQSPTSISKHAFMIKPLLEDVADQFRGTAQKRGLQLRLALRDVAVTSEPRLLRRLLMNLVSNALRYTVRGGVLIGFRRRGDDAVLEIWDTGRGIAGKSINKVISTRQAINVGLENTQLGMGLGLDMVRRAGSLLGHDVRFQSRVGEGSVFRVTLPLAPNVALPKSTEDSGFRLTDKVQGPFHVLSIDDDDFIGEALKGMFDGWGVTCDIVQSVEEVTAAALRMRPDLVFVDYRLGVDVTGLETIELLRKLWRDVPPIYLLTAERSEDVKQLAAQAHVPMLLKPIYPAALRALIDTVSRNKQR